MRVAEVLERTSAGVSLRIGRFATIRTVEVRIVVSGIEEDAFAASRTDTLIRALRPILKHLDGSAVVEMVGVELAPPLFGSSEARQPLADLSEAIAFLTCGHTAKE